jgi:hypothetical protein
MIWQVSNWNRSAYLEAEPRSVPMTTMRPPIPVANANLNIGRYSDFLGCIGMA